MPCGSGERGAQFMEVGDAAACWMKELETIEHRVDRVAEFLDLIRRIGQVETLMEVVSGNLFGSGRDLSDPRERPRDNQYAATTPPG